MISGGAVHCAKTSIGMVFSGLAVVSTAVSAAISPSAIDLSCVPAASPTLQCVVYSVTPGGGQPLRMTVAGIDVPVTARALYTAQRVAILFLVDTSDPRRQPVLRDIVRELKTLVDDLPENYSVGLARFDSEVEVLHPVGPDRETLRARLNTLRATGRHTELYRATQVAARIMAPQSAERKVLFLVSDGLAEDRAYGHVDTVAQARRYGVAIFGLGFPNAARDVPALQVLRRLSEDTGGVFAAADRGRLPDWFRSVPPALDAAERIEIDLSPVLTAGFSGPQRAVLQVNGAAYSETTVVLPESRVTAPARVAAAGPRAQDAPVEPPESVAASPGLAVTEVVVEKTSVPGWGWAGIAAALLAAAWLTAIIWAGRQARLKSLAYLCSLKNQRLRYQVKTLDCRIGRHRHNELVLSDPSVSRFHAQLIRNRNGTYAIYDRASKNGIRVGNRPVASTLLKEGDVIDLGRVQLRFTQFPVDLKRYADTVLHQSAASQFDKKRRRHPRQPVAMRVRLYHDHVGWLNGQVRDLSADGAFIETERSLLPRTPIDMVVPVVEQNERRWLRFSGEIVRENNDGFGMLFTEVEPAAARVIDSLSTA